MPQARGTASTRAVDSLNDSNPKTLEPNQELIQLPEGGVVLRTTVTLGNPPRERITERRVDSEGDLDHLSKGGKVWWKTLLNKQKAEKNANASKKVSKKVTSDE